MCVCVFVLEDKIHTYVRAVQALRYIEFFSTLK